MNMEMYKDWREDFEESLVATPSLKREFADYQCNYYPGELDKNLPKFFCKKVVLEGWSVEDFQKAVVGIVCQRMKFRNAVFERCVQDPTLQQPNPKYAKKSRKSTSPSSREWRERQLELGNKYWLKHETKQSRSFKEASV